VDTAEDPEDHEAVDSTEAAAVEDSIAEDAADSAVVAAAVDAATAVTANSPTSKAGPEIGRALTPLATIPTSLGETAATNVKPQDPKAWEMMPAAAVADSDAAEAEEDSIEAVEAAVDSTEVAEAVSIAEAVVAVLCAEVAAAATAEDSTEITAPDPTRKVYQPFAFYVVFILSTLFVLLHRHSQENTPPPPTTCPHLSELELTTYSKPN